MGLSEIGESVGKQRRNGATPHESVQEVRVHVPLHPLHLCVCVCVCVAVPRRTLRTLPKSMSPWGTCTHPDLPLHLCVCVCVCVCARERVRVVCTRETYPPGRKLLSRGVAESKYLATRQP